MSAAPHPVARSTPRAIAFCAATLLGGAGLGVAQASPFGDGALGTSAQILGTSSQSAYDERPLPPTANAHSNLGFTLQDPLKSVGSAGVQASAAFGRLYGSSGASASWVPQVDGNSGGGSWTASTGYTGSPGGLRMTYFGDILTVDAAGHTGQAGIVHANLLLNTAVTGTLPNVNIGPAASERSSTGFSADIVTGAPGSWGESGLRPATSHLAITGGQSMSNGPAGSTSLNEMQVLDMGASVYEGVVLPQYRLSLDIPVVFGQAFELAAQLQSGAWASVGVPALPPDDPNHAFARYAFAQASVSLTWDGISSVDLLPTDGGRATGYSAPSRVGATTLTDFTVASASGTDYTQALSPVPEPPSALLLLAGAAGLGWRRRGGLGAAATAALRRG
jgi:hypothetical protein